MSGLIKGIIQYIQSTSNTAGRRVRFSIMNRYESKTCQFDATASQLKEVAKLIVHSRGSPFVDLFSIIKDTDVHPHYLADISVNLQKQYELDQILAPTYFTRGHQLFTHDFIRTTKDRLPHIAAVKKIAETLGAVVIEGHTPMVYESSADIAYMTEDFIYDNVFGERWDIPSMLVESSYYTDYDTK